MFSSYDDVYDLLKIKIWYSNAMRKNVIPIDHTAYSSSPYYIMFAQQ